MGLILISILYLDCKQVYLSNTPYTIATSGIPEADKLSFSLSSGVTCYFSESDLFVKNLIWSQRRKYTTNSLKVSNLSNQYINEIQTEFEIGYWSENIALSSNAGVSYSKAKGYDSIETYSLDFIANWKLWIVDYYFKTDNLINKSKERVHPLRRVSSGLIYNELDFAELGIGAFFEEEHPFALSMYSKVKVTPLVSLIASFRTDTDALSYGMELKKLPFKVLYAVRSHPELKLTHAISISYSK